MKILQYTLKKTCSACPEQYDVYDEGNKQVGYLRLRHGNFRAYYLNCEGEVIYRAHPYGDGRFLENEREYYLTEAIKALHNHTESNKEKT